VTVTALDANEIARTRGELMAMAAPSLMYHSRLQPEMPIAAEMRALA
jgi:hypothetical protein